MPIFITVEHNRSSVENVDYAWPLLVGTHVAYAWCMLIAGFNNASTTKKSTSAAIMRTTALVNPFRHRRFVTQYALQIC